MADQMGDLQEILDRVRRIETRVTKVGRALDVDVGGGRPEQIADNRLAIPTPNCSIGECVRAIAIDTQSSVQVYVGEEYLVTLVFEEATPRL